MNKEKSRLKDSNFDTLYNQVYSETFKELSKSLRPAKLKLLIITIILTIILFNKPIFILLVVPTFLISILLLNHTSTQKYRNLYKSLVLQRFIQLYDKNLKYIPDKGISNTIYNEAEFEKCEVYTSEDLIYGKLDNYEIKMAKIDNEKVSLTSDGNTQYTQIFEGLLAVSTFENNFDGTIKIRNDRGNLINTFKKKNKLEMDSQEFEKYFDVIASNKLQAMQVLTSDIMDMLINFQKDYNIKVELTIKKHKIFIRFHHKIFFEPPFWGIGKINYNILLKDYNLIKFTLDISRALIKSTAKTKI